MRIQQQITQELQSEFEPLHLEVEDESHTHNVPDDNQSHFRVTLVSERFVGKPLIARHRAVNSALKKQDIMDRIHALALHTLTPEEWFAKGGKAPESPPCLGGGKS